MRAPYSRGAPPVPAVLRLVQTVVLGRWRATGEDLYREVARLGELEAGRDVVVSGCGEGATSEWLAARTGAAVTGVDADAKLVARAESRARGLVAAGHLAYEHAPLDDLPHENAMFDCAIGEPALSAAADPARAVAELARVTKPMGVVVLLQLTWSSELSESARELVVERLGLRPRLLMEWKQMLRDAGVVQIEVEDWTSGGAVPAGTSGAVPAVPEVPDLTWGQKAHIVGRAMRRWGWRGARGAVERETGLLEELSHERAIGFQVLKGVRWPHAMTS
jgi:2-polyprenyl-3-methyl-5-hydroxy-6-metoxy-1,4-benzoquinol methylase